MQLKRTASQAVARPRNHSSAVMVSTYTLDADVCDTLMLAVWRCRVNEMKLKPAVLGWVTGM